MFEKFVHLFTMHLFVYSRRGHDNFTDMNSTAMLSSNEQEKYLSGQDRAVRLDAFTHCLIAKCTIEV